MKKNNRTRLAALLLVFMTITACGKELEHIEPLPIESIPQSEESIEVETSTISTEPAYTSYLTGLPVTEEQQNERPIAVMLNNIEAGCPQYGIAKASVIYEAPVESRITRLMGIFEDWEGIEKIGYVRSSRDYFVYCAMEHDAIYCHFGQATPYVGELLNSGRVDTVSAAVEGIDHPAKYAYYRTSDRKAPHNVATTGPDILKDVENFGYNKEYEDSFTPKFQFSDQIDTLYQDMPDVTEIYPGGQSTSAMNGYGKIQAYFIYEDGKYYRYQYGGPHIDEETGEQLTYDNVILQYCYGEVRDQNDYLAFRCHGDDGYPVQVFTQGKMINGTWSRAADDDPAIYVDENGERIQLSPGKTWVCFIWTEYAEDVQLV